MGIKDKATYGEYYWAMQVEASKFFADEEEEILSNYVSRIWGRIRGFTDFPDEVTSLMDGLSEHSSFALSPVAGRFLSEVADGAVGSFMSPILKAGQYGANDWFRSSRIPASIACILGQRQQITEEMFDRRFHYEGYQDTEARFLYDSTRPYPTIPDLILWGRYHGDPEVAMFTAEKYIDIDPRLRSVWDWLALQRLTTLQVQTLFKRELISSGDLLNRLAKIGWSASDRPLIEELGWSIPNAMLLVQGDLQQAQSKEQILKDISIADINPKYAQQYLDAILTKPASTDIIAYELRIDPELSELSRKLQKIGIHPEYTDLYKELAYQIPPIADIITMAVREAFTPEIAAKFGQYEDYPRDLEEWGVKKGLSREWSERYWAAHWSLPSATQGFEMLHRGVINRVELDMLLRALDVMPFWRDKLTGIAFRRLSRVDIRRMYRVGVLTEIEVYEAYLELGYNERDARRMSDFTVKQTLATQSKFTARDVIGAYSKYMINRSEARSLLLDVGVKSENIEFIISTAEYKRSWELTANRITAIRNLYKKEVYTPDQARSELLRLDMPAERVDVLMEQWYIDEKDKPPRYWTTAQTLSFIKAELISSERGRKELGDIGYDAEHINVYMKASE